MMKYVTTSASYRAGGPIPNPVEPLGRGWKMTGSAVVCELSETEGTCYTLYWFWYHD